MTPLHPDLDRAIDKGESRAALSGMFNRGNKPLYKMSQMIAGEACTGKTTQALEYIAQMHDVGLIDNPTPYHYDCGSGRPEDLSAMIDGMPEGSAIILDQFNKRLTQWPQFRQLVHIIVGNYDKVAMVIVGEKAAFDNTAQDYPELTRRFPAVIELTTVHPRDRDSDFNIAKRDNPRTPRVKLAVRAEIARREKLLELWRNAKAEDFILKKSMKPVKTVRFTPKDKAPT